MTKNTIKAFLGMHGWTCSYSGHKPRTMYVNTFNRATQDDVQIAVVQEFGILPDFELRKQE